MTKEDLLKSIRAEHKRLEDNIAGLSEAQLSSPGVAGIWSIKDILAHLTDWEQRFLRWYRKGRSGQIPQLPEPGMTWRDMHRLNNLRYEYFMDWRLEEVLTAYRESYESIYLTIEQMTPEEIFTRGYYAWTENANLARFIIANTSNHYLWAKTLIRKWRKASG